MGFRFRKSINLGGFRINLSKSGIGYSFGVKGLRHTHKAGGGTRTTVGIPGTGLSYVHDSSSHKAQQPAPRREEMPPTTELPPEEEIIESTPSEMIDRLNRASNLHSLLRIGRVALLVVGVLLLCCLFAIVANGVKIPLDNGTTLDGTAAVVILAILAAACFAGAPFCFLYHPELSLRYDFTDDAQFERDYNDFTQNISALQTTDKIWELSDNLPREKSLVSIAPLKEPYLDTDLSLLTVCAPQKTILFLPDIIAVKQRGGWAGVAYSELDVCVREHPIDEFDAPSDAKVLSQHWLHANQNGTRDKRFTENPMVYRCQYGELELSSKNGLHAQLLCSSLENAQTFCASLQKYIESLNT